MAQNKKAGAGHPINVAAATEAFAHVVNGRVVSMTLAHPDVLPVMQRLTAARREDPQALLDHYRRGGVVTASGNLTARYRAR